MSNKNYIEYQLKEVEDELYRSLGSKKYFVEDGYVKEFDDCYDIFIDTIKIRKATSKEQYLYEKKWELKDKLKKMK